MRFELYLHYCRHLFIHVQKSPSAGEMRGPTLPPQSTQMHQSVEQTHSRQSEPHGWPNSAVAAHKHPCFQEPDTQQAPTTAATLDLVHTDSKPAPGTAMSSCL
jgi:hypothetical protein